MRSVCLELRIGGPWRIPAFEESGFGDDRRWRQGVRLIVGAGPRAGAAQCSVGFYRRGSIKLVSGVTWGRTDSFLLRGCPTTLLSYSMTIRPPPPLHLQGHSPLRAAPLCDRWSSRRAFTLVHLHINREGRQKSETWDLPFWNINLIESSFLFTDSNLN